MLILKCKICGGDMSISEDKTFGVCEYCGNTMTLPKIDDEVRAAAFNRGNHFRRTGEFDKALQVYEKIVEEDPSDAEAHWCCALCRFGIEWVEDPATMEYLPTCHRASFDPFTEDVDCKAAIELSEGLTKRQYQKDAARISEIQKGILATSQSEEPFDVFICYKESDDNGNRTVDSTLAQDVYYQLTDQGLRTFFARITLEDKVGSEYEPYIFAALNSAKAMVVIGTKPEHFNAVWVKNEWSRYLAIVKRDRSKVLLPCYRDMDPYDLPEQLSILQSYDMSKIGFMQDLIRGIKKITQADEPKTAVKETVVINGSNASVAPLLKRAFMYLEDGEWQNADEYCERVLDQDPENAQAYLGKLMAELNVHRQEDLADCALPFNDRNNFKKAVRFGDNRFASTLTGYIEHINERNEQNRLIGIYNAALNMMNAADDERKYKEAAEQFNRIAGFQDADQLSEQCLEKAEISRKDSIYARAESYMNGVAVNEHTLMDASNLFGSISGWRDADELAQECSEKAEIYRKNNTIYQAGIRSMNLGRESDISEYEAAIKQFRTIPGWKDADNQILNCEKIIEKIKDQQEADRIEREQRAEDMRLAEKAAKKRKTIISIVVTAIIVCIALVIVYMTVLLPKMKYNKAMKLINSGSYEEAYALLEETGHSDEISANKYERAKALLESGDYDAAYAFMEETGHSDEILANKYERAKALLASGNYEEAYALLEETDHNDEVLANKYERAKALLESGDYDTAYAFLEETGHNDEIAANKYERATAYMESDDYEAAAELLKDLDYKDTITNTEVGKCFLFGSYEQDNNPSNGKEDIEWLVLAKEDDKVLVISKYALDVQQYDDQGNFTGATWETCYLRDWLNSVFVMDAFSHEEKDMIQETTVKATENPKHDTNAGNDTNDRVFLLSIDEANKYFDSNDARQCQGTEYSIAQEASSLIKDEKGNCCWWLRTPGNFDGWAATVRIDGSIDYAGDSSITWQNNRSYNAVRPAMWIDLGS